MVDNYYIVTAKCGHVGRNRYIPIDFPVKASNGRDAAKVARLIPRVKHHNKDAILNVIKVDHSAYLKQITYNDHDPYLHVTNKQNQRKLCKNITQRIIDETPRLNDEREVKRRRRITYLKKKRQVDEKLNLSF